MYELKICKWCEKEFIAVYNTEKYCSKECAKTANMRKWIDKKKQKLRAAKGRHFCEICGEDITDTRRYGAKTCEACGRIRPEKKERFCIVCGTKLEGKQKAFCGAKCARKYHNLDKAKYVTKPKKKAEESTLIKARKLTKKEEEMCKKLHLTLGQIYTIREGFIKLDYYIKLKGWKYGICS